jgi:hypothetical protein
MNKKLLASSMILFPTLPTWYCENNTSPACNEVKPFQDDLPKTSTEYSTITNTETTGHVAVSGTSTTTLPFSPSPSPSPDY